MAAQDDNRVPFARDWYLLSDINPSLSQEALAANNESNVGEGLLSTELRGQNSQPRQALAFLASNLYHWVLEESLVEGSLVREFTDCDAISSALGNCPSKVSAPS